MTFVTSWSLKKCAENLDNKRLMKQLVEASQIIDVLLGKKTGWANHPACKMWEGHVNALKRYYNFIHDECRRRGFNIKMKKFHHNKPKRTKINLVDGVPIVNGNKEDTFPWWFLWRELHLTHQASLLRKDPDFYSDKFTDRKLEKYINHGYIWPSKIQSLKNYSIETHSDKIGSGAPAQYQVTKEECIKWKKNPEVNPNTGRKIKVGAAKYILFDKAYKFYFPNV